MIQKSALESEFFIGNCNAKREQCLQKSYPNDNAMPLSQGGNKKEQSKSVDYAGFSLFFSAEI
ncbi:hypothetical protein FEM08_06280 [Flavobacterium gilvum]|nr:hypothetical protein FEM08_06280 [Flavobacterium gilvum]